MSLEDLKTYAKKCTEDDALRAKAKEIGLENIQGQIEHAKTLGLTWDENDMKALAQEVQSEGELSDGDLEQVAGGFGTQQAPFKVVVDPSYKGPGKGPGW